MLFIFLVVFKLKIILLGHDLYTIKCIYLKCTFFGLVFWNPEAYENVEHYPHLWEFPQALSSPSLLPRGNQCSDFYHHRLVFPVLSFIWMESYFMYFLVFDYFPRSNVYWRTSSRCLCQQIIPFRYWVLFHCLKRPQCAYSFSCRWTFGLLPVRILEIHLLWTFACK